MRTLFAVVALAFAVTAAPAYAQQADASLETSAYISRGFPAVDRDWTPVDYSVAARVLADVPYDQLPRTNSVRSGAVVDRMVNRSSLALCQNQGIELGARMQLCAPALGAISQILMRYSEAMNADLSRGEDNLRIMNYCLLIAADLSDMMTAFVPTLDPNASDYQRRIGGINQARNGLAQMVEGTIMSLEAPVGAFPEHARVGTAGVLAEVYPRIMANAAPEARPALEARVRAVAQNDRNAEVRAALRAFAS